MQTKFGKSLVLTILSIFLLALVACGGSAPAPVAPPGAAETVPQAPAVEETAAPAEEEAAAPSGQRTRVRWFVGLGAGTDEPMFVPQEEVVAAFNASQNEIELVLEIVDADQAYATLATQIAAGNAPDLVGPVGIRGRDFFRGAWLDLNDLIESTNYDLSDFDEELVKFYVDAEEGQLGLPFAIFPSFLSVNLDLFDEAGLNYPPQEYGAPYIMPDGSEVEWSIDTMTEIAKILTVDSSGNDATEADFDPNSIVQFGFGQQWTDMRGALSMFGAGSVVDENDNAQIPDHWVAGTRWYQQAMWEDYIYPSGPYGGSEILGNGNWFESGNIAMAQTHLWYQGCCMGNANFDWDTAVMPTYNGEPTAKMPADTFGIMKSTRNPEATFAVLTYFLGDHAATMTQMYGGMPARLSLQDAFFSTFAESVPGGDDVNWDVVVDSMAYPDNPNHESYMPSPQEANERYNDFWTRMGEEPNFDLDTELDRLVVDLQAIFDAANQ